jgi:hypothetical protein
VLGVELLGADSCLLPHPKCTLLLEREAGVGLQCRCPWWNRHHGLSCRSALQPWCGCDGCRQSPSVVPSGRGGQEPSSLLKTVWNFLEDSSIMARSGDSSPLWFEPMRAASESLPLGERLRLPKQSAMNSRIFKQTVSPWEKPPHVKCSPSTETASADEGTIRTSRGKVCYKSPYLACQLSVFSAPGNYVVVKITHSNFEVVLHTMKHTMISPSSDPSSEIIVLCAVA